MPKQERNNEWSIIVAVALIGFGLFMLLERLGAPWWEGVQQVISVALRIGWPVLLIGIGVLLLVASRRGTLGHIDTSGKRLWRSRSDRVVSGVLGGLGAYLGVDPTWLRIGYALLTIFSSGFPGVVLYIIATVAIPEEPKQSQQAPQWPSGGTETVQAPPAPPVPQPPAPEAPPAPPAPPRD